MRVFVLVCFCSAYITRMLISSSAAGVRFGPPGSKRLVYFVDDMNMPFVDKYDTQSAIELIRQSVDYRGWFDKVKIVLKEVTNTQYCACMNPTAGSFNITPRMQRHFVTFAVQMPHMDIVRYASAVAHISFGLVNSALQQLQAFNLAHLQACFGKHIQAEPCHQTVH